MKELIVIQSRLKAAKSNFNSYGKYNYRSCEDILEALKPLLKEQNCFLVVSDEILFIGNRFYVKSVAAISNGEGLQISSCGLAREEESKKGMDGAQVTGAASSYARKYALNGLFAIDDSKDADSTNDGEKEESIKLSPEKIIDYDFSRIYGNLQLLALSFFNSRYPDKKEKELTFFIKNWCVKNHEKIIPELKKIVTKNEEK